MALLGVGVFALFAMGRYRRPLSMTLSPLVQVPSINALQYGTRENHLTARGGGTHSFREDGYGLRIQEPSRTFATSTRTTQWGPVSEVFGMAHLIVT